MELHVDDDAFVRVDAPAVYRRLTDVGAWPEWWPGVAATPAASDDGEQRWTLVWRDAWRRTIRMRARVHGWRLDTGFRFELAGDLDGWSEFWLERHDGGTVIHHLLVATTAAPRPLAQHASYRRVLRRGLWACKDQLQSEARVAAGLAP